MTATVASRELRNSTRALLKCVEAGEQVIITVNGRPAAALVPLQGRSPWVPRERFLTRLLSAQADSGLRRELAELAPDSTDELRW